MFPETWEQIVFLNKLANDIGGVNHGPWRKVLAGMNSADAFVTKC